MERAPGPQNKLAHKTCISRSVSFDKEGKEEKDMWTSVYVQHRSHYGSQWKRDYMNNAF